MAKENIQYPKKTRELQYPLLDSTVWNAFEFRSDDIIIASYSKSGPAWVQQIVAQMSPWLDCRFPSNEEKLAVVAAQTHRRFVKSHLPVDALVFSPQAKYIYMGRDGRDILWSLHNHHRNMKPDVIQSTDATTGYIGHPLGCATESTLQYFRDWLACGGDY